MSKKILFLAMFLSACSDNIYYIYQFDSGADGDASTSSDSNVSEASVDSGTSCIYAPTFECDDAGNPITYNTEGIPSTCECPYHAWGLGTDCCNGCDYYPAGHLAKTTSTSYCSYSSPRCSNGRGDNLTVETTYYYCNGEDGWNLTDQETVTEVYDCNDPWSGTTQTCYDGDYVDGEPNAYCTVGCTGTEPVN